MNEEYMSIVEHPFDPEDDTTGHPFGKRWGGDVFALTPEHLAALQAGKAIALDVMNEYLTFLILARPKDEQ